MATTPNYIGPAYASIGPLIATANTTRVAAGTLGTDIYELVTGSGNGVYVESVLVTPHGTNAASILRLFLNNGSDNNVAANNRLVREIELQSSSASETVVYIFPNERPVDLVIPNGYRLLAVISAFSGGNPGWSVQPKAFNY